jgi:hypothetical protein
MMDYFIDVANDSLNKFGEELCGDKVEIVRMKDGVIIVLADGLGSGVKANILGTITAKIAATLLKEGADIYETVDTIVNTLPVCKVRNIAYATFTLIKVHNNGRVYIAEYDNPPVFLLSNSNLTIDKKEIIIKDKKVLESNFILGEGDILTIVSDGVIHAGVGNILNLGWQWDNVNEYLMRRTPNLKCAKHISMDLLETCNDLYNGSPGDDTTVVAIKIRKKEEIDLFTGPPVDSAKDAWVVKEFMKGRGKKIVCGGTAANIVSRELKRELVVNLDFHDIEVPPTASMKGIDLITEGVLTLSKVVEKLKNYSDYSLSDFYGTDGVSRLIQLIVDDCTHLNLWIGKAINPAHQNPNFPIDLSIKLNVIEELVEILRRMGKEININYV